MSRLGARTLLVVAVAAVTLVVGAAAESWSATAGARGARPRLSESQILRIAEHAAAQAGDPTPTLIQHGEGTRHRANLVASGDRVPGSQWSYLIAERGSFVLKNASVPSGAVAPRGDVLTLVVNARSGRGTDGGVSDRYPDLASLGAVRTDLRQLPPGCLRKTPLDLRAEYWARARRRLAPTGANSIELCGYGGLNARPMLTLDRMRMLRSPVLVDALIQQLDRLPPPPKGVRHCPADDLSRVIVELGYPDGRAVPVSVRLTGCRSVTNGTVKRDASGYGTPPRYGPQLIRRLRVLLAHGATPNGPVLDSRAVGADAPRPAPATLGDSLTRADRKLQLAGRPLPMLSSY